MFAEQLPGLGEVTQEHCWPAAHDDCVHCAQMPPWQVSQEGQSPADWQAVPHVAETPGGATHTWGGVHEMLEQAAGGGGGASEPGPGPPSSPAAGPSWREVSPAFPPSPPSPTLLQSPSDSSCPSSVAQSVPLPRLTTALQSDCGAPVSVAQHDASCEQLVVASAPEPGPASVLSLPATPPPHAARDRRMNACHEDGRRRIDGAYGAGDAEARSGRAFEGRGRSRTPSL